MVFVEVRLFLFPYKLDKIDDMKEHSINLTIHYKDYFIL